MVIAEHSVSKELVGSPVRAPLLLQGVRFAQLEVVLDWHVVEELPQDPVAKGVVVEVEQLFGHPHREALVLGQQLCNRVLVLPLWDGAPWPPHPARGQLQQP